MKNLIQSGRSTTDFILPPSSQLKETSQRAGVSELSASTAAAVRAGFPSQTLGSGRLNTRAFPLVAMRLMLRSVSCRLASDCYTFTPGLSQDSKQTEGRKTGISTTRGRWFEGAQAHFKSLYEPPPPLQTTGKVKLLRVGVWQRFYSKLEGKNQRAVTWKQLQIRRKIFMSILQYVEMCLLIQNAETEAQSHFSFLPPRPWN